MLEVTRGQVDNEINNKSQYSNISNNIQSESLIYESESIAIRNGKYWNMCWNTARITQECDVRTGTGTGMIIGTGTGMIIGTGTGTGTKL